MENEEKPQKIAANQPVYIMSTSASYNEEEFIIFFSAGEFVYRFVVSPKHFKRITLHFQDILGKYEKQFSELKTSLKSPEKLEKEGLGFQIEKKPSPEIPPNQKAQ